jgi:N-acetylglucosamine kinase-like BadF-type ATPase
MENDGLFLGVEGAAKTSRVAVALPSGELIIQFETEPLNPYVNSNYKGCMLDLFSNLSSALNTTIDKVGEKFARACFSISGIRCEYDENLIHGVLSQVKMDSKTIVCENFYSHLAANMIQMGGLLIAGTGSTFVLTTTSDERIFRFGGWGSEISDEGSGYSLGIDFIKYALDAIDGIIVPDKALLDLLCNTLKIDIADKNLIYYWFQSVKSSDKWRIKISDLAIPLISLAEKEDNEAARNIVRRQSEILINKLLRFLRSKIDIISQMGEFEIVLEGGLFSNSVIYTSTLDEKLNKFCAENILSIKTKKAVYYPVIGSLFLAFLNDLRYSDCNLANSLRISIDNTFLKLNQ